jgi:tetratricopeptide (TPR) repeat protein
MLDNISLPFHAGAAHMNLYFQRKFFATAAATLLAATLFAADTNTPPAAATRDEMTQNYLQIQEQIHATQIAIEQAQQAAAATAKNNADALAGRLQSLEQSVAAQRAVDSESARKTQQLTLLLAGAFGVAGLGVLLLMAYFQWRAFSQLAQISSHHRAAIGIANDVHQLAAPGRVTVETSSNRLLDVVSQLEKRIHELEGGQKLLPETGTTKSAEAPAQAQTFLDLNQPQRALDVLETFLASHPSHAGALVKKAMALEKLGLTEEALADCDRAIAANTALADAYLQKGGLLNRLRRYDEALDCFEKALAAQEKKPSNV